MADLKIRNAIMEAELSFLRDVLASEPQAERLALIAPTKPVAETKPESRKAGFGVSWLTHALAGWQKTAASTA